MILKKFDDCRYIKQKNKNKNNYKKDAIIDHGIVWTICILNKKKRPATQQ